ncbi:hypothetical protein [Sulfurospirillum sp. MES]|uniref:hypothetical protein n=1 Tax=Sulfurospirillum sp. MES TaxID=1565314 RepID=UPI000543CB91|nr:hypothetical protein [Sulfurospirillum sp. MES]KHG34759.1 MAG: hypothetical protein OA34_00920 [Sulfurospirillum sp. MES]
MENSTSQNSNIKFLSGIIIGILIPLLASVMPWLINRIFPDNALIYSFQGPISVKNSLSLEFLIENRGNKAEEKIEAWIPIKIYSTTKTERDKDGKINIIEVKPKILMESDSPLTKLEERKDDLLLTIDSIKPKEKVSIKLFIYNESGSIYLSSYSLERVRVTSKDVLAVYDNGPSKEVLYMYKIATWILIFIIILFFSYAIYYENIMPREKKEKYLLDQIDKLK